MANTKNVLIPWDFTYVTNNALLHAFSFLKMNKGRIVLLNVIKDSKIKDEALKKLNNSKKMIKEKYNQDVDVMVKEGSIFKAIDDAAQELDAVLVLMGTHGMQGMQKITGSWALKVIASSETPFIVVQGPPKKEKYDNIVFPVDFRQESKQKIQQVSQLAHLFNSKVHVFVPNNSDDLIMKKINNNLLHAKNYLEDKEINYQITTSMAKGTFTKQVLDFARYIEADLIAIVITKDIAFNDYIFGAEEQQLIANNLEIPVMCVNPSDTKRLARFLG
jgi:nucleotide-binding universal stress UspA family protein